MSIAGREAVYGFFGKLMKVTEGSFHLYLHTVLADDEHGVALAVATVSRGGRSMEVNEVHVFHLHDGKVVEFWNAPTDPPGGPPVGRAGASGEGPSPKTLRIVSLPSPAAR